MVGCHMVGTNSRISPTPRERSALAGDGQAAGAAQVIVDDVVAQ
jgi:hypothetical protein